VLQQESNLALGLVCLAFALTGLIINIHALPQGFTLCYCFQGFALKKKALPHDMVLALKGRQQ